MLANWFLAIKTSKITNLFLWHFGHELQPRSEQKKIVWMNSHDLNLPLPSAPMGFSFALHKRADRRETISEMLQTWKKIMSQIPSKTTSQRFPQSYPPRICNQSWNQSRNKKVENALFAFQNFLNTINPQTNTTKEVVNTLPNYHEKEFAICQKNFQLFTTHQSIKIHFQPI